MLHTVADKQEIFVSIGAAFIINKSKQENHSKSSIYHAFNLLKWMTTVNKVGDQDEELMSSC